MTKVQTSRANLTNGKLSLTGENFVATPRDLCQLIKVCAKHRVTEIVIGDLRLTFLPKDKSEKRANKLDPVETKRIEQASQQISDESQEHDRLERLSEDLEELKLQDPLAYERLLGGELIGDGTETS